MKKFSLSLFLVFLIFLNVASPFTQLTSAHVTITYEQTIEGLFSRPMSILLADQNIYVVDDGDDTVKIFTTAGTYVSEFGGTGSGGGLFTTPHDIETNGTHLFVSDWGVSNVQIFDLNGNYIKMLGGLGSGNGQFFRPAAINFNGTNILIADSFNDRIQIFDENGNYLSQFDTSTEVVTPFGVASNYTHIFVADYGIDEPMEVYDSSGSHVTTYGNGQLRQTVDVEIHGQLKIVSDSGNGKMWVYDLSGNNITHYGEGSGLTNDRFNQIKNIDSNSTHLAATDSGNTRIQIFTLDNPYVIITLKETIAETSIETETLITITTVTQPGSTITEPGITNTVTDTTTIDGTEIMTSTRIETQTATSTTEITNAKSEAPFPNLILISFTLVLITAPKILKKRK